MISRGTTFSAFKLGTAGFCIHCESSSFRRWGQAWGAGSDRHMPHPRSTRKLERLSLNRVIPQGPSWLSYVHSQSSGAGFRPQRPDMTGLQEVAGF